MKTIDASICLALSLIYLTLLVPLAQSTTFAQLSLAQLTASAHVIVRAEAVSSVSVWHDGEIWTITTFRVEDNWKGHAPEQIQVWMIGGQAGRITSYVAGAPRFRAGEDAVLFLEPKHDGELSITAWGEGTFRVRRDARTGEARVTQDTAMVPEFAPSEHQPSPKAIRNWPLGKFKARVMRAVASNRGNP